MNNSPLAISVYRCPEQLHTPYALSFGTVETLDTYYVLAEGPGRVGFGEITPLPGYSDESVETVEAALADTALKFSNFGAPWDIVGSLSHAPFVASGFATALESWQTTSLDAFTKPLPGTVPLIALCQAEGADKTAETARQLIADGYLCLCGNSAPAAPKAPPAWPRNRTDRPPRQSRRKMKLGQASVGDDISRVRAAAAQLPRDGELRLDANQGLEPDDARQICQAIETDQLPVTLLEQPFGADDWQSHADLAGQTSVPLMFDESIRTDKDLARAHECGAKFVKLKLCKHTGRAETAQLVRRAREFGFGVVFGNGVQTALGNHIEAQLHLELDLETASEANGFLKVADPIVKHRMTVTNGELTSGGLVAPDKDIRKGELVWTLYSAVTVNLASKRADAGVAWDARAVPASQTRIVNDITCT